MKRNASDGRASGFFILPPRSPEFNDDVERAHVSRMEESYEVTGSSFGLGELRIELMRWEEICNRIRPHQALSYLTPSGFVEQWKE